MDAAATDWVKVEEELRRLVRARRGLAAYGFKYLSGEEEFWKGSSARGMAVVEDLDQPRECEVVALTASSRFGLGVAHGYVLIGGEAIQHYWNHRGDGVPIDGALARRRPTAYLGKRLTDDEIFRVGRFARLSQYI